MISTNFRNLSKAGQPLTNDQVRAAAPSAFAVTAHDTCSSRYTHIATSDVIDGMRKEGFVPTFATQCKTRDSSRQEHTKHLIRFRREAEESQALQLGGLYPEIILVNSHDGSSAYQLFSGLFRLVCLNGLMTGSSYESAKIRHKGDVIRDVIEGSFVVIEDSRRAVAASQEMAAVQLSAAERLIFAEEAHALRFEGSSVGTAITPEKLLTAKRLDDKATDLWTTLNVVQENAIRGGLRGWTQPVASDDGRRPRSRRVSTRAVNGIDQATSLNRALFSLAEKMAELKKA